MNQAMSIDDLRLVLVVAQHQSFVAAARQTGIPSSSVSRAVARFEDALGVRLFQRTSRSVSLTDEGQRLLQRSGPLLEQLAEALDDVKDQAAEPSGKLRVSAPIVSGSGWIASALLEFGLKYPAVNVELQLSNVLVDLTFEGFDLAFRGGPVNGADLVARKVCTLPYAIAASESFAAANCTRPLGIEALETLPAVVAQPRATWPFRSADGTVVDVQPAARLHVNDLRVAVDAARRGFGLVRAPKELIASAGLVEVRLRPSVGEAASRSLYAVYPTRRFVPRRVRLAVDWVAAAAQKLDAATASRRVAQ